MMEVVQENAAQAQTRQKHCYDQGTSDRTWEVGQQVLVHTTPCHVEQVKFGVRVPTEFFDKLPQWIMRLLHLAGSRKRKSTTSTC